MGRISAQVDFDYDKRWPDEPKTAFFGFYECIDDVEVSKALFAVAEEWAREQGPGAPARAVHARLEGRVAACSSRASTSRR